MESDQTYIEKTFELINQLNGHITLITIKVLYITNTRQINLSKAITDIHNNGFNLDKSLIFYLDNNKKLYVHIGTFPFPKHFQLLLKFQLFLETTIKLRFRKLSGPNSPKNQKNKSTLSQQNKRTRKQKTIQQVQQIVTKWRNLFQSTDQFGKKLYTLESAAQKLGMQKKTLDDYYYKIKNAHSFGFDFDKFKNDKIGVLRQFVKQCKKSKQQKTVPTPVFNQWLNNQNNGHTYQANMGGFGCTSYASSGSSYPSHYPPQKPSEDDIDKYFVNDQDESSSSDSQQSD